MDNIASCPGNASGKASLFTSSLDGEFAAALQILTSVLGITKLHFVQAQHTHNAGESVCGCITTLQQMHTEGKFKKIFETVEQQHGKK